MKKIATLFLIVIFSFTNICFSATSQIEKSRSTAEVIRFPSGSTGIELYNTADQTTNFEKFRAFWNSNVLELGNYYGGTGVTRAIRIGTTQSAGASILGTYLEIKGNAVPFFNFVRATSNTGIFVTNTGLYGNASSGEQIFWAINPQVAETGTASYVALEVNPTETSTGSGTKLLQRWAVGSTVKATMDNTGLLTTGSTTLHATNVSLTNGAGVGAGTITNAPAAGNPTKWIPINDNGTTRYIPAW